MSLTLETSATPVVSRRRALAASLGRSTLSLLIVGAGPAAHALVHRLVSRNATSRYRLTVFSGESEAAYDRPHLSQYFDHHRVDRLLLATEMWYRGHHVALHTGRPIAAIDRSDRRIIAEDGESFGYDELVLATGSRSCVPRLPGIDSAGVFTYRTLSDLRAIEAFINQRGCRTAGVLGGGILGVEIAIILQKMGLETTVVEHQPVLMPRHLGAEASDLLRTHLHAGGIEVRTMHETHRITHDKSALTLTFEHGEPLRCDLLIVAAGVRPNDDLAQACGLAVSENGGVLVDANMTTTDRHIHAIGECVSFQGQTFGHVSPCCRMAEVLAERLLGGEETFAANTDIAELMLPGMPVVSLGRSLRQLPGGVVLWHRDDDGYRELLLEGGRVVGASAVGTWPQLADIRRAVCEQWYLWPRQRRRFCDTGSPWPAMSRTP